MIVVVVVHNGTATSRFLSLFPSLAWHLSTLHQILLFSLSFHFTLIHKLRVRLSLEAAASGKGRRADPMGGYVSVSSF